MPSDRDAPPPSPFAVSVVVVALMIRDEQLCVLLKEQGAESLKGQWALPAGFVRRVADQPPMGLDETAAHTLGSAMGLLPPRTYLTQLAAYCDERDDRGDVVSVAYVAINPSGDGTSFRGAGHAAHWLPVDLALDGSLAIAFDHRGIIDDAVERTRERIGTSSLALAFCDEWFTIPNLRRVYEVIWGLPRDALDAGTFHKRFVNMIEQVSREELGGPAWGVSASGGRGRPPKLYRAGPLVWSEGSPARFERPIERPWPTQGERSVPLSPESRPDSEQLEWESSMHAAKEIIWKRASSQGVIHYGELAEMLGMHRRSPTFFDLLDALCLKEESEGGPLVTSLVVNKKTGMPGQRFFVLAGRLGRKVTSLREFVDQEQRATFEWIRNHPLRD